MGTGHERAVTGQSAELLYVICGGLDFLYVALLQKRGKNDMINKRERGTFWEKGRHFGG